MSTLMGTFQEPDPGETGLGYREFRCARRPQIITESFRSGEEAFAGRDVAGKPAFNRDDRDFGYHKVNAGTVYGNWSCAVLRG